jgi:Protein of unknown function (DUF421)
MAGSPLDGTFASADLRRRERRWQVAGVAALLALIAAALFGLVGEAGTVGRAAGVYGFLLVVHAGALQPEQMASEGVTNDDLLMAARQTHGLQRLDEIDHAILESNGAISIVPVGPRQG